MGVPKKRGKQVLLLFEKRMGITQTTPCNFNERAGEISLTALNLISKMKFCH